jgi:hypothetical protein
MQNAFRIFTKTDTWAQEQRLRGLSISTYSVIKGLVEPAWFSSR